MRVRQSDIAHAASVSTATVSLVLSGRARALKLSEGTIANVLAAAAQLGYSGNYHARALSRGQSMTLGLVVSRHLTADTAFWNAIALGVNAGAVDAGYDVLLMGAHGEGSSLDYGLCCLADRRVDALIVSAQPNSPIPEKIQDAWPIVFIGAQPGGGYPVVTLDAEPGIRAAVAHLAELGHRRICWLGMHIDNTDFVPQRTAAFHTAARDLGIATEEWFLDCDTVEAMPFDAYVHYYREHLQAQWALADEATAVLCFNDMLAQALCTALSERGRQIPDDISVIGFDDLFACYAFPSMTTISHGLYRMGQEGMRVAVEMLATGQAYPQNTEVRVPASLVVRQSTRQTAR